LTFWSNIHNGYRELVEKLKEQFTNKIDTNKKYASAIKKQSYILAMRE
jgi:ribosomal protein S17E